MAITQIERGPGSGNWDTANWFFAVGDASLNRLPGIGDNTTFDKAGTTTILPFPASIATTSGLEIKDPGATLLVTGSLRIGTGIAAAGDTHSFKVTTGHLIVDGMAGSVTAGQYVTSATGLVEVKNGATYLWQGSGSTQTVNLGSGFGNNFTFTKDFGGSISGFNSGEMITFSGTTNKIEIANNKIHFKTTSGNFTINLDTPGVTYDDKNMSIVGNSIVTTITEAQTSQPPDPSPSAATVIGVTSTTANNSYNAGDVIEITVTFSKAVEVTGTPTLALETGSTDRIINFVTGSGTDKLVFNYLVQPGDTSGDLDYLASNALASAGGSIKNANGNVNANLTLPTPGAAGSLGANNAIVIDTTAPAAPSGPILAPGSDTGTSNSDRITNVTKPVITGTAEAGTTVTLYDDAAVLGTAVAIGGIWSITPSTNLPDGVHTLTATATDAAGNAGVASTGLIVTIDSTKPTLTITSNFASLKIGETANISFNFSEDPGSTFTSANVVVAGGTLSAISDAGLTRTATFTPTGGINGGSATISVPRSFTDTAGNAGPSPTPLSISFDTLAPAAPGIAVSAASDSGLSNSDRITNVATPDITDIAEAGATVTVYDGVTVLGTATATDGGTWSFTAPILTEGVHTLRATATDAAGNTGAASSNLSVTIDTTAPSPKVVFGTTTLGFGESTSAMINFAEKVDQFGLEDLTATGGVLNNFQKINDTTFKVSFSASTDFVGIGSIDVAATYRDVAGNTGSMQKAGELNINATAPADGSGGGGGSPTTNGPTPNPNDFDSYDGRIPALIVADFVNGGTPATAAKLADLAAFAKLQYGAYLNQGVTNPGLGPYEALGRAFAETSAFQSKYGSLSESIFIQNSYKAVFGKESSFAQQEHFQNQIDYFEGIYEKSDVPAAQAEGLAKGAVLGQMLGIATLEGPASNPYLLEATNFLIDAADGIVSYGKPLSFWDVI